MLKIAIPTRDGQVDSHFGHCNYYTIVTTEGQEAVEEERLDAPQGCGCKSNIASVLRDMGVTVMLAGNMGQGAVGKLQAAGIEVVRGCLGDVRDVAAAYLKGDIQDSAQVCDHHDCAHHDGDIQRPFVINI